MFCFLFFLLGIGTRVLQEAVAEDYEEYFTESTRVEVRGDRLSVSLVDADLDEVLREIGRQGNIKIIYKNPPDKQITVSFENVPIEKGLDRLLEEQNFLLIYSRTEPLEGQKPQYTISQLFLLEKSKAVLTSTILPQPVSRAPSPSPPPSPQPELVSPDIPEPPDAPPIPGIPPNVINDILARDPEAQEELLETLHEAIKTYPEEVSGQLTRMLNEMQKQGLTESKTFQEALERMLTEQGETAHDRDEGFEDALPRPAPAE